jgi:hypothetical protein
MTIVLKACMLARVMDLNKPSCYVKQNRFLISAFKKINLRLNVAEDIFQKQEHYRNFLCSEKLILLV